MKFKRRGGAPPDLRLVATVAAAGALAGTAATVAGSARVAERANPPLGRFIDVGGVKMHYIERGVGPPVVLLHGNALTAQDWITSGVLDRLAVDHRVFAFDRPGFGYSSRPRSTTWTPAKQAELIHAALAQIGVVRPIIVGHSWGTMVALALGLDYPADVGRLVLLSGYYFPSMRLDAALQVPTVTPLLGDVLRYTIVPIAGRLMVPLTLRQLFGPAPVPDRFAQFPLSMSLRPSQLRAAAEEAVLMVPSAADLQARYSQLDVPVSVIAGSRDRVVNAKQQSNRLAKIALGEDAQLVAGAGHMVHYFAPDLVVAAVRGNPVSRRDHLASRVTSPGS